MLYKYPIYPLSDGYGIHLEVVKPAEGIVKMASEISGEASNYVKTLQPDNDIIYVLTNALGASEFYGPNKNLDYTPEAELAAGGSEYGYLTFSNAHVFRDHLNKDPKYKIGDVLRAFWNPRMHRVELLLAVYKHKAPDIADRLNQMEQTNDLVGVSYGLKCPSEVCSICGNRNTTRPTRCYHLKYELGKVYPNGSKTMAITEKPIFYDISFVWNRANLEAIVMTKLASVSAPDEQTKQSEVDKIIETNPSVIDVYQNLSDRVVSKLVAEEPPITPQEITSLGDVPLKQVLASLSVLGIMLSPEELISVLKQKPSEITDLGKFAWTDVNPKVFDVMANKVASRSFYRPFILERVLHKKAQDEVIPPVAPETIGGAVRREIYGPHPVAPLAEEAGLRGLVFRYVMTPEQRVYTVYRNKLLNLFNSTSIKAMPTLAVLLAMGFGLHYFKKALDAGAKPLERFPRFIEAGSVNPVSIADIHQAALSGIMIPSQPVLFTPQYKDLVSGIPAAYILGKGIEALDISEKEVQNLDKNSNASYGKIYDTEEAANTDMKIIETLYSGG